jgi:hypothetical protein
LRGRNTDRLVAGLEVKWIGAAPISKQRLVDDLLRLECLKDSPSYRQSAHRFFLVAGSLRNMKSMFLGLQSNSGNGRVVFLSHLLGTKTDGWHEINVRSVPPFLRKYFISYEQSYRVKVPSLFRTRLIRTVSSTGFQAMLWRVDSGAGRRGTFSATSRWRGESVPETEGDE